MTSRCVNATLAYTVARSVAHVSVCVMHTGELCKTAEPIAMPFGGSLYHLALHGIPVTTTGRALLRGRGMCWPVVKYSDYADVDLWWRNYYEHLSLLVSNTHTHTHNRLTAFCPGLPG